MEAKLQQQAPQKAQANKPNLTGIPTQMKLDFEQRSGLSFDDVRVHYNSDKPAQLQALAYTQGTQVYVGPGQERHLPHELGHVVQQKYGMVTPNYYTNGLPVNMDLFLESAAEKYIRNPSFIVAPRVVPYRRRSDIVQKKIYIQQLPSPYSLEDTERNSYSGIENYLLDKANRHGGALKKEATSQTARRNSLEALYDKGSNTLRRMDVDLKNFAVAVAIELDKLAPDDKKIDIKNYTDFRLIKKRNKNCILTVYAYSMIHAKNKIKDFYFEERPAKPTTDTTDRQGKLEAKWATLINKGLAGQSVEAKTMYHTEPKILDAIMERIKEGPKKPRIDVYMYSERDFCPECTKIINHFNTVQKKFDVRNIYLFWSFNQYDSNDKKDWITISRPTKRPLPEEYRPPVQKTRFDISQLLKKGN